MTHVFNLKIKTFKFPFVIEKLKHILKRTLGYKARVESNVLPDIRLEKLHPKNTVHHWSILV